MEKIVECVPNFSEGRNLNTIEAITRAIVATEGCRLLDIEPGHSTNRCVVTFVGSPDGVVEGAMAATRVARKLIDMQCHHGTHPRFGALDVCPFIPVKGVSMEECVQIARRYASLASQEMNIPFYLYEEAARQDYRRSLAQLRENEYEGLAARLIDPRWAPDFGPTEFDPRWGITATGARKFLIAYNVNLLATPNQAHRIALNIRQAGRGPNEPGRLKAVKGMGWFVKETNMAQVTVNLSDYHQTPPHILFEEVVHEAQKLDLAVVGSEIVGVIPKEAMLMAADYYIDKEKLFIYQEEQKIALVISRLGLNSVSQFVPDKRIIDYIVEEKPDEPLASLSLRQFIEETGGRSSAPGGGSASAAMAAMGVALGAMVTKLTHGVRRFETVQPTMEAIIPKLHRMTDELISMIDADTRAFNDYMDGARLPQSTLAERKKRTMAMQAGLQKATNVPLTTMKLADSCWDAMADAARYANIASRSDLEVGARALETGIWGAYRNVVINIREIEDTSFRQKALQEAQKLTQRATACCAEIQDILEEREQQC